MNEYTIALIRTHTNGVLALRLGFVLGYLAAAGRGSSVAPALWEKVRALAPVDIDTASVKAAIDAYFAG